MHSLWMSIARACASLHLVLLCDVALPAPAFAIDMSNASRGSSSSSGSQVPKGSQDSGILEFEAEMIDADVVNVELPEPGDMQSCLQHAFAAALCLRHKPAETIEPRMLIVFLDAVTPKQYAISPKDTLLAMLMHKTFAILVLTTKEAVGKTTPSKHETSYGIQYRNLCIVGLDPKYNIERTFAEEADERLRDHCKFLKCVLSTHAEPIIRELKCLGVTSCPPSRTPYMRDLTIFYISTLSMLFDVCDQSCWQSCVTPVEIRVDVLALCIPVF